MNALTALVLLLAAAPGPKRTAAAEPPPAPGALRLLAAALEVPDSVSLSVLPATSGRAAATLRTGAATLLLTVYGGEGAPNRWAALTAHADELLARVDEGVATDTQHALFGRPVTAREVRFTRAGAAWVARVVAAQKDGHTVVATWTWPAGAGDVAAAQLADLVSAVRVHKLR